MFWDGERWLTEEPKPVVVKRARRPSALLATLAAGFIAFTLLPLSSGSAEANSGTALISQWASSGSEQTVQEGSTRLTYRGRWFKAYQANYLGGAVRSTNQASASVALAFTGNGIAWIGPKGPTRGWAAVYVDGRLAARVSSFNSTFRPAQVLFQRVWTSVAAHTIKIVAAGTASHPTVALDAFAIRGTAGSATPASKPRPRPTQKPLSGGSSMSPSPAPAGSSDASPAPTVAPSDSQTIAPTQSAPATPAPTPAATSTPAPTAAPTATAAPTGKSVRVTSIAGLLAQLADNSVTEIVVADGTYVVPDAASHQATGLWIDGRFASRTNPVLVRAETLGGVTLSGGGATGWSALDFRDGAHDQTWQGFNFADGDPTQTGVIVFGQNGSVTPLPPYRITLLDMTVGETVTSANPPGVSGDHAVYFSRALGRGPHDIVIDRLTVRAATSGLDTAVHFYGSQPGQPNADTVAIRHLTVYGTDQAVVLWDPTLSGITVSDSTITGASQFAVRYEGGTEITLERVVSTGSGRRGFSSSLGASPPGVTFTDCDLN